MPRKKKEEIVDEIAEKLNFLGLNLNKIPQKIKEFEQLEYRILRSYDENKYKQYRYVNVNDIQILLSPVNRLTDLNEKYKKAKPLHEYLDFENEDNIEKHTTFLNMLKSMDMTEIRKIELEQEELKNKIPFNIRYEGNYLWQIYYSENTDKYFMIVPTEDANYSAFFYLLKKKLENKKLSKIFVPISNVQYSNKIFRKPEFEDVENYLWLFTKNYPSIYEVYDKKDVLTVEIVGEANIYEKVRTPYKIQIATPEEAGEFYKLLKALFILQTELDSFYEFKVNINKQGKLELFFEGKKVEYKNMIVFIREEFKKGLKRKKELEVKIKTYNKKLEELKQIVAMQEIEYLSKEKQISTFLECKKTFFGKFKYYFKYSNKKNNKKIRKEDVVEKVEVAPKIEEEKKEKKKIPIKKLYTLEELITNYKELEELESKMKNLLMDTNALKLKNKNMDKKIENATKYIQEIDNHKKSIFEFWKYSNKDEISVLPEGEMEEVNVVKNIEKTFDYQEDLEKFGEMLDKLQREKLTQEDTDNVFIATTNLLDVLNKIKEDRFLTEDIENSLQNLKREAKMAKNLYDEEYDIFGNVLESTVRLKKINNKRHRELPKDKFRIVDVTQNTKQVSYRLNLQLIIKGIENALAKITIPESMPVYIATDQENLNRRLINVFNINPEDEMKRAIKTYGDTINFFKVNLKKGMNGVGFTNCIFYDNKNKTLPVGMDLSSRIAVDLSKIHFKLVNKTEFNIGSFDDENSDFANLITKKCEVTEYDIIDREDLEAEDFV